MAVSVTLPALGESVTEGTVTRWLKQPGDTVAVDEPLLEVSTDKVDTEIPSPAAGTLLDIKVSEDETVEVGAELATIGEEGESAGDSSGGEEQAQPAEEAPEAPAAEHEQAEDREQPEESVEEEAPAQQEQPAAETKPSGGGSPSGTAVTLPALGESVTEGTITRWLKQVGDSVETDEALLEVSTDKVDTEIPSPTSGTLLEIKVGEDETVEVGAELATIGSGEPAPAADSGSEQQAEPAAPAEEPAPAAPKQETTQQAPKQEAPKQETPPKPEAAAPSAGGGEKSYVTPLVRKLAAEHDVDLTSIEGTGVGGRVRKQDVLQAAEARRQAPAAPETAAASEPAAGPAAGSADEAAGAPPVPSPLRGKTETMTRMRRVIASHMTESLRTSAQLTTVVEVDVTGIARLRNRVKDDFAAREGVKLSFNAFFAKAAVDALKSHPKLNASIDTDKGEITYHDAEHLGFAVDTERGLLVAVVKDAGDLSIAGLSRKIADLAERSRSGRISPDDLSGGTFTITNTGSRGALFDTPIINQPQVGILGTGSVVKRPVVIDDERLGETIAVRHMVYLALTYDHQLVDGADAARFLADVKQRLEAARFDV
ncbi:MAG TPA: 2-oxoglutarate dehydrogenase, E2 component, dihydrolipoamide succinyltransferase [Nocardioidaceae bacterium]|nr:2-oxoglutarate dehydrogenase, E2 component, dihydrolipoamide succinyltransferase [Nocardioidaceae bacterium]